MKFVAATLVLYSWLVTTSAFSAVAPNRAGLVAKGSVDRSMKGIDDKGAFDPTQGENPALTRNNNDEVWVKQVCSRRIFYFLQPGNVSALSICQLYRNPHHVVCLLRILSLGTESPPASQPKVCSDAWHGPRKHCHPIKLHLPSLYS